MAALPGFLFRTARSARRVTAVSAVAVAVSAASLAAIPAAQAAPAAAHRTVVVALSPAGHGTVPGKVVRCRIGIVLRYPHPISATGRLRCSNVVRRITILVRIIRNGRVVRAQAFSRTFVSSIRGSIAVACVSGRYRARVDGKVRLRNGQVLTGAAATHRIRIAC